MSLQVHADPQGHLTRLGYYADLFLALDEPGHDGGPGVEENHVGYISAWRLSKEPNQYAHEEFQPWVTEWLQGELGDPDDDSRPFKETLRLLYDETGQLRAVNDESLRSALDDTGSELVFIEMIWIKYKDEKTGFPVSFLHVEQPLRDPRLIARGLVLLPTHCTTRFGTALLNYEQRNSPRVVQRQSADYIRLEGGHAVG